jgi:hypothetical protein
MKTFTTKTKMAATIAVALGALAGAALAHGAPARDVSASDPKLVALVVRLGEVQGFWAANCPIGLGNATAWAQGDDGEAAALHGERFALGVRELLRSASGATGVSVALRFRSAAGAASDLERRELLAGDEGYATNFSVPGARSVRAYTVRTEAAVTVHVAFTRGTDEYAIAIAAAKGTDVDALQRSLAAAVTPVARRR